MAGGELILRNSEHAFLHFIFSPTSPAAAAEDMAADSPAACNPAPKWPAVIGNVPKHF